MSRREIADLTFDDLAIGDQMYIPAVGTGVTKPLGPLLQRGASDSQGPPFQKRRACGAGRKAGRPEGRLAAFEPGEQIRGGRVFRVIGGKASEREQRNNGQTHNERAITQKRDGVRTGKHFSDRMRAKHRADHRLGV